jgi:molybdopterin synthase catalytic subunit
MKIEIQISDSPLSLAECRIPGCGAVARFDGIVRATEDGRHINALEYEAYESMALSKMRSILEDLHREHPFELARVRHRIGRVPVGDAAIIVDVHSAHRGEAFSVLVKFMDRLKQDVPIWKVRVH